MLARITPGASGFDVRTFECPACDLVHQLVVELIDPMKSLEAAGSKACKRQRKDGWRRARAYSDF